MLNKNLQDVTEADLQQLIDNSVQEGKTLEYKQTLELKRDSDKKEFLADVSSFANAVGGDIIIGIACNKTTREPEKIEGLQLTNTDSEIQKIENVIRDGIEERMVVHTVSIPLSNGLSVIIIRIPQSWNSPHMVVYQGAQKFYTRSSNGKYAMDVSELRSAFTLADKLATKIANFRTERIGKIYAGSTDMPLPESTGKIVLHIIPFSAFTYNHGFPFDRLKEYKMELKPMNPSSWDHRYSLNGFMAFSLNGNYTLIFKNGIIEAVDAVILGVGYSVLPHAIPSQLLEEKIIEAYAMNIQILKDLNVEGPFAIFLSLVSVKQYWLATRNISHNMQAGNRMNNTQDLIALPEHIVDNTDVPVSQVLKPIFDSLWNVYGYEKSENFDPQGNWRPR